MRRKSFPLDSAYRVVLLAWITLVAVAIGRSAWLDGWWSAPRGAWFFFVIAVLAAVGIASATKRSSGAAGVLTATVAAIALTTIAFVSRPGA